MQAKAALDEEKKLIIHVEVGNWWICRETAKGYQDNKAQFLQGLGRIVATVKGACTFAAGQKDKYDPNPYTIAVDAEDPSTSILRGLRKVWSTRYLSTLPPRPRKATKGLPPRHTIPSPRSHG